MRWPAKGVVATVSETNPIVWLVPVRRLRETMFGRYPVSRAALQDARLDLRRDPHLLAAAREHERGGGLGDAGAARHVGERDPLRPRRSVTSVFGRSLDILGAMRLSHSC